MKLRAAVTQIELHRSNNLLAIVTADYIIRLLDLETRRVVRVFQGHEGRITDLVSVRFKSGTEACFIGTLKHGSFFLSCNQTWSPDARWLVSGSMDGTIRTWGV